MSSENATRRDPISTGRASWFWDGDENHANDWCHCPAVSGTIHGERCINFSLITGKPRCCCSPAQLTGT